MKPDFQPWLFDCRIAWEKALSDPRWNYDLPISNFMALYNEHRTLGNTQPNHSTMTPLISSTPSLAFSSNISAPSSVSTPEPAKASAEREPGQILSQSQIDDLLISLGG